MTSSKASQTSAKVHDGAFSGGAGSAASRSMAGGLPNRPKGRTTSTSAMIRNSTTRVSLEKTMSSPNHCTVPTPMQKALATPIRMAARNAPPMLPSPPTTVTTKASAMTARSRSRLAGSRGICSAPPSPASTEPAKNTEVKSLA